MQGYSREQIQSYKMGLYKGLKILREYLGMIEPVESWFSIAEKVEIIVSKFITFP